MITATNLHGSTVGSPFVTCKDSHLAASLGNITNGVLGGVVGAAALAHGARRGSQLGVAPKWP